MRLDSFRPSLASLFITLKCLRLVSHILPPPLIQIIRLTRSGEASEEEIAPMHTFFKPQCGVGDADHHGCYSSRLRACSRHRPSERKTITVRNNTNGKVSCLWRIPLSDDDDDELDFEVIPDCADISPDNIHISVLCSDHPKMISIIIRKLRHTCSSSLIAIFGWSMMTLLYLHGV